MDHTPVSPQVGSPNSHAPELAVPDEWQRIDLAYREIQRRDGSAELRAWRWERFALVLLALFIVLLGVIVWQLLTARMVQAVVQVVHVDDKGQLVQVGMPQDLLAYTPPDGLWMDMLGAWVRRLRWRGTAPCWPRPSGRGCIDTPAGRPAGSCKRWKSGRSPLRWGRNSSVSS